MLNQEIKDKLLNVLKVYDPEDAHVLVMQKFIEEYDGNDETHLTLLFLAYTGMLNDMVELKIKAKGYDELLKIKQTYDQEMNDIKAEFDKIENEETKILLTIDDPQNQTE